MSKISYREEDDKVNSPHSCTSPRCTLYTTSRDGVIDIKREKGDTGIQYRLEKKEDTTGLFLSQLLDQNMEQYINIKVCYCKIYITDTYICHTITSFERSRSENT